MAVAKARRKKATRKKAASKKKATSSARRKPSARKKAGTPARIAPKKARVAPKKQTVRRKRARTRAPLLDAYAAIVVDEQDSANPLASDEYSDANQLIDEAVSADDRGR
jgi:hypothetical protein